jgi:hypothetical protein
VLYGNEASPADESPRPDVASTDLTLVIGLVVAFAIFVAVVVVIVKILKRKTEPHPGYSLTQTGDLTSTFFFLFFLVGIRTRDLLFLRRTR